MLWGTVRRQGADADAGDVDDMAAATAGAGGLLLGLRRGALTNLLNPKVGVFYVAVLPQFIPAGAPHLAMGTLLTCVHVTEGLIWSAALVAFAGVLRNWLRRPVARRVMDRVTGVVVVGFGLRLALGD